MSATTKTGGFPIGFRRMSREWHQDLKALSAFSLNEDFAFIDLHADADTSAQTLVECGQQIGSVDLPEWRGMISSDKNTRREAIERNTRYIEACSEHGPMNHFLVMIPEDANLEPKENFDIMVDSFGHLQPVLQKHDARLVIEGYPAPGALCCTPESCCAFFDSMGDDRYGVNYDPSHLIRMGIDPIRFLREFAKLVYHVHAKDTFIFEEALYEYGNTVPALFHPGHAHGAPTWRYTIPGRGRMDWQKAFEILSEQGYRGKVSIELEDEDYRDSEVAEKEGFLLSRDFLVAV